MSNNTKMPDGLLPLFPLEAVLFPHTPLPLHIFEDRYKEMIGECLELEKEFGVVLARGQGVVRTGCTAKVVDVLRRHEDGELDILTVGRQRFQLKEIHSRRTFLEGEVEFFDDIDFSPTPLETVRAAATTHEALLRLSGSTVTPPKLDHPELSFQLARIATDLNFRQVLLEMRSESERIAHVAAHLEQLLRQRAVGSAMKKVAPSNGHGKHLSQLTDPE
ncbi:MAG TPA: LON peptidase substrate-binding domain-containing protein [Paludibaculum sp.]